MNYVDGFVVPVPKKKLEAYAGWPRRRAKSGATMARWNTWNGSPMTCSGGEADVVPAERQTQARRDGDIRLDRVQVARRPRPHQRPR